MATKQKSRIIQEMEETIAGLHKAGVITKKVCKNFQHCVIYL
jgi:hypothetical protein